MRTWPTLVAWIAAGREDLLQRLRVRRLADDLKPEASERQRRQALEQLAALAAAGGSEQRAVRMEATESLSALLAWVAAPEQDQVNGEMVSDADREDAALVLALIGAEEPLRDCLANPKAAPTLRRRAAESLGLLARRCGKSTPQAIEQRLRIETELEGWLRSDALNLLVEDAEGWAEHDARLPCCRVPQGACNWRPQPTCHCLAAARAWWCRCSRSRPWRRPAACGSAPRWWRCRCGGCACPVASSSS
ncbi:MAG: hypothetical protein NT053_11995 [Cyanobacteria bacterium]|nr:hypothetical protein [Cyanobacteriota bacterium]